VRYFVCSVIPATVTRTAASFPRHLRHCHQQGFPQLSQLSALLIRSQLPSNSRPPTFGTNSTDTTGPASPPTRRAKTKFLFLLHFNVVHCNRSIVLNVFVVPILIVPQICKMDDACIESKFKIVDQASKPMMIDARYDIMHSL